MATRFLCFATDGTFHFAYVRVQISHFCSWQILNILCASQFLMLENTRFDINFHILFQLKFLEVLLYEIYLCRVCSQSPYSIEHIYNGKLNMQLVIIYVQK